MLLCIRRFVLIASSGFCRANPVDGNIHQIPKWILYRIQAAENGSRLFWRSYGITFPKSSFNLSCRFMHWKHFFIKLTSRSSIYLIIVIIEVYLIIIISLITVSNKERINLLNNNYFIYLTHLTTITLSLIFLSKLIELLFT